MLTAGLTLVGESLRAGIVPGARFETADVSLVEGTIAGCNYSFFFASPRNRTQEADGSIPFSSTTSFDFSR
jgi:hypothetical protein